MTGLDGSSGVGAPAPAAGDDRVPSTPRRPGYRGLASNTDLDMRVGYDPTSDRFWAHIHDTNSGQVLLDRADLADLPAVQRTLGAYGQVPGPVLSWLDRDRQQAHGHARADEALLIDL